MCRVTLEFPDGAPAVSERHAAGHCRLIFPGKVTRSRVFTYRHWHQDGAVDIDFAMHGGTGPAARWIKGAQLGTPIGLRPGGPPKIVSAPRRGRLFLVADSAGLPVVSALIEKLGCEASVLLHIRTAVAADAYPKQAQLFENEDALYATFRRIGFDREDTLFVASEASLMRRLRRHALDHCGLAHENVFTSGYWKRGHANEVVERIKQDPNWFGDDEIGGQPARLVRQQFEEALQVAIDGAPDSAEAIIEHLRDRSHIHRS